jgi:hypothetical protein
MIAIFRGELSNPPPFPFTQNANLGNQDGWRGQQKELFRSSNGSEDLVIFNLLLFMEDLLVFNLLLFMEDLLLFMEDPLVFNLLLFVEDLLVFNLLLLEDKGFIG